MRIAITILDIVGEKRFCLPQVIAMSLQMYSSNKCPTKLLRHNVLHYIFSDMAMKPKMVPILIGGALLLGIIVFFGFGSSNTDEIERSYDEYEYETDNRYE